MRRVHGVYSDPFGARVATAAAVTIFLLTLVGIRLFVKAVVAHGETLNRAEQQYLVKQTIEPERGTIYVTDYESALAKGKADQSSWSPLAANRLSYSLSVVPRNIKDPRQAAEALSSWAEIAVEELYDKINNKKLYLPPLKKGLSEEQKDQLTELDLPGMLLIEEENRYYPEGPLGSHIVGFVNAEKVGNYGVEQAYDEDLRGSGGEVLAERDVRGRLLSAESQKPVRDGSDLVLSIDRNVQWYVEKSLTGAINTFQADSGTVVVLDMDTGGIIAMASYPNFNPNEYSQVPQDEQSRFLNPAISAVWEPGSIFKTVVMAAALDHDTVEPETEGVFSNYVTVAGYDIHTAEDKAFGKETMTQVLENSDNVAMVWLAEQMGNEKMAETLVNFGFGEKLGVDLPGEVGGYLLAPRSWKDIYRATMSFGQGISTTPLQVATAMATLGNGGKLIQPHIVEKIISSDGTVTEVVPNVIRERVISAETSAQITAMMVSVVERGHGKRAKVPGYAIAGKTGTAQVPNPEGGYYEDRHIGGFAGFFPADKPRFAMVVKLDQPKTVKFAESSAAPTFGEIAKFMLNYYRIQPTEVVAEGI